MSAERITYVDKELGENPRTVRVQQWWFEDANEVKNSINGHADRLDQFVFEENLGAYTGNVNLAGNFGVGGASTGAKLHVENTAPGQKLLELKTFGGATTLQADDNGSVWNSGVSGSVAKTFFGFDSGISDTGNASTGFGNNSLKANQGNVCTGIGQNSLQNNTGNNSSGHGVASLQNNTGFNANGIGFASLQNNSGNDSSGIGSNSLQNNTGSQSNGIGSSSLKNNTGVNVNGIGGFCLADNNGDNSNGIGESSLRYNDGNNNTGLGHRAGFEDLPNTLLGTDNTFLGSNASYGTNVNVSNATAVGANITLSQSNSVVLGDTNVTDVFAGGDGAGINLKSPNGTNYRITVDNAGNLVVT